MVAESTEAWLMTLRKSLSKVERDSEEAWIARRELAKLLVEKISIGRNDEGRRSRLPTGSGRSKPR